MNFKKWVKSIQTAGYNGRRMVPWAYLVPNSNIPWAYLALNTIEHCAANTLPSCIVCVELSRKQC